MNSSNIIFYLIYCHKLTLCVQHLWLNLIQWHYQHSLPLKLCSEGGVSLKMQLMENKDSCKCHQLVKLQENILIHSCCSLLYNVEAVKSWLPLISNDCMAFLKRTLFDLLSFFIFSPLIPQQWCRFTFFAMTLQIILISQASLAHFPINSCSLGWH